MLIICRADIRPPTAPVLGTPSAVSTTSLSVPMTTPATDAAAVASYALERATSAAGTYSVVSSTASFPYVDTGLSAATTYYYRARATDTSGNVGNYSAIVSGTTQSAGSSGFTAESGFIVTFPSGMNNGAEMWIDDAQSRFGTKPNGALPLNVFTYESNANPHPTWSRTNSNITQSDGSYQTSPPITMPANQVGVYRTDMTSSGRVSGHGLTFTGDKCFKVNRLYYGWNWLGAPANTNLKICRLRSATGDHTLYLGAGFDGVNPQFICENTGGASGAPVFNPAPVGVWVTNEILYRGSTGDTWDARFDIFQNARLMQDWAHAMKTKASGLMTPLIGMYGDQISNNEEPAGSYIYCAFEYLDDSWCHGFMSSETSYQQIDNGGGSQFTREHFVPFEWSASRVKFYIRRGSYSSFVNNRFYVRNDAGTVLRIGRWS